MFAEKRFEWINVCMCSGQEVVSWSHLLHCRDFVLFQALQGFFFNC